MKTLYKWFKCLGDWVEKDFWSINSFSFEKVENDINTTVYISKYYSNKPYSVEVTKFIGDDIGKISKYEVKTISEVKNIINNLK